MWVIHLSSPWHSIATQNATIISEKTDSINNLHVHWTSFIWSGPDHFFGQPVYERAWRELLHCMLLATSGTVMLRASPHYLSTQVAIMVLTWPAENVIVIADLNIDLTARRAWMTTISKKLSLNLAHHLAVIHHPLLPHLNRFLGEKFAIPTPEVIVTIDCLITAIAEILSTIVAYHLVTPFNSGDCHLTRWTLFGITKYFLNTEHLIDHFLLTALLFMLQLGWILSLL